MSPRCRINEDVVFEWLRDGAVVLEGVGDNLELALSSVRLEDQGTYTCRVTLSNNNVIGPASGGELVVLG